MLIDDNKALHNCASLIYNMFQFMRKTDKSKTEKGTKQQQGNGKDCGNKLSPDDLHRLDEIRRSFKLGKGKKEKLPSGIIADYSENFLNPLRIAESATVAHSEYDRDLSRRIESESSESSLSSLSLKESPDHGTVIFCTINL